MFAVKRPDWVGVAGRLAGLLGGLVRPQNPAMEIREADGLVRSLSEVLPAGEDLAL